MKFSLIPSDCEFTSVLAKAKGELFGLYKIVLVHYFVYWFLMRKSGLVQAQYSVSILAVEVSRFNADTPKCELKVVFSRMVLRSKIEVVFHEVPSIRTAFSVALTEGALSILTLTRSINSAVIHFLCERLV